MAASCTTGFSRSGWPHSGTSAARRLTKRGCLDTQLAGSLSALTEALVEKHKLGFPVAHGGDARAVFVATGAFTVHPSKAFEGSGRTTAFRWDCRPACPSNRDPIIRQNGNDSALRPSAFIWKVRTRKPQRIGVPTPRRLEDLAFVMTRAERIAIMAHEAQYTIRVRAVRGAGKLEPMLHGSTAIDPGSSRQ